MKKIAVFGGTFDPVQTEHVKIAEHAVNELNLDKIIIMPDYVPPHKKNKEVSPATDRLKMCEIAFSKIEKAEVSSYEIDKQGDSYTYLTMEHFKQIYPDSDLYFIVGTDMLNSFASWRNPERILAVCTLIYVERSGDVDTGIAEKKFTERFGKKYVKLSFVGSDVSATMVRTYLKLGLNVDGILADGLKEYIADNGLYKPDKYYSYVLENLPEKRRLHTAGVILTALKLAERLNVDKDKAELSALLHDSAKYKTKSDFPDAYMPDGTPPSCEHQYLGAYVAEKILGVTDEDVLTSIRFHTTGRANMSDLEKVVYIADLIEPSRKYAGVDDIRRSVAEDFEKGFKYSLKEIYGFLQQGDNPEIDQTTVEAVKYYLGEI